MRKLKTLLAIVVMAGLTMMVGCSGANDVLNAGGDDSSGGGRVPDSGIPDSSTELRDQPGGSSELR